MLKVLKKFDLYLIAIILLAIIGIGFRLFFLLENRGFWWDECSLALNIINSENYFKHLMHGQAAPQLFMYISKLMYILLPQNPTFALKLLPFSCSIAAIFVFYKLSTNILNNKFSQISSMAMFCICFPLCRYAQEFKQYSADLLAFILVILSYFYLEKIAQSKKRKILYTIGIVLLTWFSYCTPIALFLLLIGTIIYKRNLLKPLLTPICFIGFNTLLFTVINSFIFKDSFFYNYWSYAFINKNLSNLLSINYENTKFIFNSQNYLILTILVLSTIFICIKNIKSDKIFFLVSPVLLMHILSYLHIYPYSHRLILFLVPIFILLISKVFDYLNIWIGIIIFSFIMYPMTKDTISNLSPNPNQYYFSYIDKVLDYAIKKAQPDEVILIPPHNEVLYYYYKSHNDIPDNIDIQVIPSEKLKHDIQEFMDDLNNLPRGKTYYYILAHNHFYKDKLLNAIQTWLTDKNYVEIYNDGRNNYSIRFRVD